MPIDARDLGTPDEFVERDPSMIRLTGKHPFNAEPPLASLEKEGWLTPNELHFVRNHGPVPNLNFNNHTLEITGLVNKPITLTMDDILSLPRHTIPISMACAGNRRKEQNMVKQSIGFGWGPSGISTAYWTGVLLRDVLNISAGGLKSSCAFVCFEGSDNTQKGAYGTSLPAYRCMSDHFDVMLAFQMNGEWLPPDHGYPLRLIVPGCIGGRSVKWLSKIDCSMNESTNIFHDNDNKVFPTQVKSAEQATEEKWWPRPEYTLYDLNINSVITSPAHGEQILFDLHQPQSTYMVKGYAYTGGNRPLTRVEISLDNGITWVLADIKTRQKEAETKLAPILSKLNPPPAQDKPRFWTWTLWQVEIPITDLIRSSELVVRAWDVSQNTQPEHLIWNLMGMMNNCWYRIKFQWLSEHALAVEANHPTLAGPMPGGWMNQQQQVAQDDTDAAKINSSKMEKNSNLPTFTMEQVALHTEVSDCWIVVHDCVYDCTPFMKEHPGGVSSILITAGTDTTEEFDAIHSSKAQTMLKDYLIGYVDTTSTTNNSNASTSSTSSTNYMAEGMKSINSSLSLATTVYDHHGSHSNSDDEKAVVSLSKLTKELEIISKPFLSPRQWLPLTLEKRTIISSTIRLYRFTYPKQDFGLPIGQHVYLKLQEEDNGDEDDQSTNKNKKKKTIMRAYTPSSFGIGWVEFIIKVYYPTHSTPGGQFSQLIDRIRVGETVQAKGPLGEFEYLGNGAYSILHQRQPKTRHIAMIAGGTGITPMWQIISEIASHDTNPPYISLIYCARHKEDLVLYDELNAVQKQLGKDIFHIRYILSKPSKDWKGGSGHLSLHDINKHLFPFINANNNDMKTPVLLCASDDMINQCCKPLLQSAKGDDFVSNNVFVF
ncbi:hypothetical protein BJ944DRAFT_203361 [Cunninghamella echinulata]|nr:hypothetical protein BJ944DRAFT_203361 [Cunninghamella echinulata]